MKTISLFRRGQPFFCPLLIGCLLFTAPAARPAALLRAGVFETIAFQNSITGTVSDASGPLPGVTVTLKGSPFSTLTDERGNFSIAAAPADILLFSFMGYAEQEIQVGSRTSVSIVLKADSLNIQEVTINAGYYSVKESERTGSIARITAKDIAGQPVTNVLAAMQGRMAGVSITQNTGTPGGGFDIAIRGVNSLRADGNRPLFIIDGMPYSSDAIGARQNSLVLPAAASPLNSINPDQIESIEVLKDADATAIYGSRGANGVVLVTTKKGKAGRTRFSASVSTGAGTVTRFMKLLDTEQYLAMREEAFANDGFDTPPEEAYDSNGTWDRNRQTDWQRKLLGNTALVTDARLAASGGNEQTQFLLSGNLNRQTTVLDGNFAYRKGNVFLSLGHSTADRKLHIDFSAGYTVQENNQPRVDVLNEILGLAPNAPEVRNADGSLNWENSTWENPLREYEGSYRSDLHDLIANATVAYKLSESLALKSNFGFSAAANDERTTAPSTRFNPAFGLTALYSGLYVGAADRKSWIAEPQLQWKKELGEFRLDLLAGGTFQSQKGTELAQLGSGFSSNSLIHDLASASSVRTSSNAATEYRYQAFFARANLAVKDRYYLNLTGRRDGSSRFGPGKQFANFGAVGGAWLLSEEKWLAESRTVSLLKLRASYGITGNDQIGDYQYLDTYTSSGVGYGGTIGIQPTRLYNPDFGWETNRKTEVALEAGLMEGRIFFAAGWYSNVSGSQLTGIPLPGTTGFSSMLANLDATVQNRGLELLLRTENIKTQACSWSSSINITFERNRLLEFPGLETSTYRNTYSIGQPLRIKKLYHSTGVDPETGLYTFTDANGDGRLAAADDKTAIADFSPDFYGGFQNEINYKSWRLQFLFQFVKQLNYNSVSNFNPPGTSNQPSSVLDRWQSPGDIARHQRFTAGYDGEAVDAYYRYMESDAAVGDGSYVRLKNISLSYTLTESLLPGMKCRLHAEAQNLLTFTRFEGADPEFGVSGYLPPLKIISAVIQLDF